MRYRGASPYNNNLKLLNYIQHLLKSYFGIKATGPYLVARVGTIMERKGYKRKVDIYTLEISRKRDVQIFLSKIGFSIRRRQLGLPKKRQ